MLQSTRSFVGLYNSIGGEEENSKTTRLCVRVSSQRRGRRWVEEKEAVYSTTWEIPFEAKQMWKEERRRGCVLHKETNDETLGVTSCVAGGHEFWGKEEWQEKTCVSLSYSLLSIHFMTRHRCITPSSSLFSSPERLSWRTREVIPHGLNHSPGNLLVNFKVKEPEEGKVLSNFPSMFPGKGMKGENENDQFCVIFIWLLLLSSDWLLPPLMKHICFDTSLSKFSIRITFSSLGCWSKGKEPDDRVTVLRQTRNTDRRKETGVNSTVNLTGAEILQGFCCKQETS